MELLMQQTAGESATADMESPYLAISNQETTEEPNSNDLKETEGIGKTALYVAVNLDSWETDKPRYFAREVDIGHIRYRRLDPEYYAWLRHEMILAKNALESGLLEPLAFDGLQVRFNHIQAWALRCFGENILHAAIRTLEPETYSPPSAIPVMGKTFGVLESK